MRRCRCIICSDIAAEFPALSLQKIAATPPQNCNDIAAKFAVTSLHFLLRHRCRVQVMSLQNSSQASSGLLSMCEISCIISEFCTAASLLNQALSHWGWVCAEGRGTSATALRAGSPGHCTLTRHAEIVCVSKGLHKSATVRVGTSRSRQAGGGQADPGRSSGQIGRHKAESSWMA